MNYIKYVVTAAVILLALPLAAASMDKTIFSSLEPHKSKTFELSVTKGKTLVTVNQSEDNVKPILTCAFSNGNQVAEQADVKECVTNFIFADEGTVTVKVVNNSKDTIDLKVKQLSIKK